MFNTHRTYTLETGVKNNTIAVFNQGRATIVIYHKTPVFVKAGKLINITNGGFDTVSTRLVINRALAQTCDHTRLIRVKGKTILQQGLNVKTFTGSARVKVGA